MNQGRLMIGQTEVLFPIEVQVDAKRLSKMINQLKKEVGYPSNMIDRMQYHEVKGRHAWAVFVNGNGAAYKIVEE